ncbi:MAG TPA: TIGR03557 family F420-dependent LLM class oxidoreductase, partial [Casimicrobiaceae bacterium]
KLVERAQRAEQAGFEFAMVSDHYHPWTDRQGNAPFVWSVLGGVAMTTQRLRVGTGVTCPIVRQHPAIVAQAAATVAAMMPGRFFLGVGTGENLNEHITGERWPAVSVRREMLEEAVEIIRELWSGEFTQYQGEYFTVDDARIYTLPDPLPHIYVAAAGIESADLAGRIGDGFISTAPKRELVQEFDAGGAPNRPHYAQITVCYAKDETQARKTALEVWPNAGLPGELSAELPLPRHFMQAAKIVTEDEVAKTIVCGRDPERHLQMIRKYEAAGFEHIFFHQVGDDQEGFFRFYEEQVLPQARSSQTQRRGAA